MFNVPMRFCDCTKCTLVFERINFERRLYTKGFYEKGFPRFVLQSKHPIQPTIGAGAKAAQPRPKVKKQMPITADRQRRRSLATAASTEDRPPSSETLKRRYQSTPPRRDVTMTTLLPRPPVRGE